MKNKRQFIVVEHSSGSPIQKAGVNYMYFSHEAAVQSIIDSLMDNFELNDDGSTEDGYDIHLPDSSHSIKNDKEIIKKMKFKTQIKHLKEKNQKYLLKIIK